MQTSETIRKWPLTKSIVIFILVIDFAVICFVMWFSLSKDGYDIPPNVYNLINWLNITIIGGYLTKSTIEHGLDRKTGRERKEATEE